MLNSNVELDVYGKYFWAHPNAASESIKHNSFNFDAITSNRSKICARVNMLGADNGLKTYAGLAYEYAFNGDAHSSYAGEGIAAPSLKGSNGIAVNI